MLEPSKDSEVISRFNTCYPGQGGRRTWATRVSAIARVPVIDRGQLPLLEFRTMMRVEAPSAGERRRVWMNQTNWET